MRLEVLDHGSAHDFHHCEPPADDVLTVRRFRISEPALVLGSSQSSDDIDVRRCEIRGVEVARRRSGGGAVLLVPGQHVWIDVFVPAGHVLWDDDVSRSSHWAGRAWCDVLSPVVRDDSGPLTVHEGRLVPSSWSRVVCFAGIGPGEVVDSRGRKMVGISQRRTREWARLQCIVSLVWDASMLRDLLRDPRPSLDDMSMWGRTIDSLDDATVDAMVEDFVRRVRRLSS